MEGYDTEGQRRRRRHRSRSVGGPCGWESGCKRGTRYMHSLHVNTDKLSLGRLDDQIPNSLPLSEGRSRDQTGVAGIKGTKGNPGHFELTYLNLRSGKVTKLSLPREGGSKNRRFQFSMSTGSVTDWATGEIVVRWGKPFLGSLYFPSLYDTVTTLVNRRPTLF